MLYLDESKQERWGEADLFDKFRMLEGVNFRNVKNRRTYQFIDDGSSYFCKYHTGVGWLEILKNLISLRLPILGAHNEWEAVNKLQQLGIPTMKVIAFAKRGGIPAKQESFIVTEDLKDTISLEEFCKDWAKTPPDFKFKKKLIEIIANTSKILHENGVCHRDYYICHFLLHQQPLADDGVIKLSLIDLHRGLVKLHLRQRWKVKDLSGLYFSAMDLGLTQRDIFRFIKVYCGNALRESLSVNLAQWNKIDRIAQALYIKEQKRARARLKR